MPNLSIVIEGTIYKLKYTEFLTKGIYVCNERSAVKSNCKDLKITIDTQKSDMQIKHSDFNGLRVITKYFPGNLLQYLILDAATKESVDKLIEIALGDVPEASLLKSMSIKDINQRFQDEGK